MSQGARIGRTWEQLIAIDQVVERHRLLAQRVDHVPIIDDVAAFGVRHRLSTPQRQHQGCAEEPREPVIVEVHAQTVADEPR